MINLGNLNNNNGGSGVSLDLKKGIPLDLTKKAKNLKRVRIGLGWQANENRSGVNYDLDASAILLNNKGLVNDNADVIFYNQTNTNRGVYSEGDNLLGSYTQNKDTDDETIHVELDKVPANTSEIRFIVTIHDAFARQQNFGQVKNAYIRVVDEETSQELCRYRLNENFALQISCEIASLKRTSTGWEFVALGNGSSKDLEGMLIAYGVR